MWGQLPLRGMSRSCSRTPGPWSPLVFLEQNTRACVWVVMLQLWRSSDRVRAWWFVFSCRNSDKNVNVGTQRSEGWALPARPCFCIRDAFLLPLFTATFIANRWCVTEKSRRSGIHLVSAFQPRRKPALGQWRDGHHHMRMHDSWAAPALVHGW